MSSRQKKLLLWSGVLMVLALVAQRIPMGHKASITVGLVEVLLAIGTGIAFGIAVDDKDQRSEVRGQRSEVRGQASEPD